MKNALIFFLVGAIAGAVALHYYQRRDQPPDGAVAATPPPAPSRTDAAVSDASSTLQAKLKAWHLTPDDIKKDLSRTGQVVRSRAAEVGGRISDTRVVAVIKAKYLLDSQLSALSIDVDCHGGEVTLSGTVKTPELIGRAVALALDTDGVTNVVSRLKVSA
jgi:hyperosmotically inducible periplasmic protein